MLCLFRLFPGEEKKEPFLFPLFPYFWEQFGLELQLLRFPPQIGKGGKSG